MIKKIAHRGDKTHAKENTMKAYKNAILNSEYVGFECDVRMTKDRKLVMVHNPLYDGKLVRASNYKELETLPLLSDVLKLTTEKIIMVDVKDPLIDVELLHKTLNSYNKNIYVISFYDNVIKALYKKQRKYKVGILNYVFNTDEKHFEYDFLCILMAFSNPKIISDYQKQNKIIVIYGVDKDKIKDLYPYYIVD